MAPRVNKRQQRELEELETLASHSNINSTDEEETVSLSKGKSGASGFTALLAAEDNVEGEEEEDEHLKSRSSKSKKSKRKKKVPAVEDKPDATIKSSGSGTSIQPLPKNEKKAAKKAKAKARKSGMDEIDAALEALSIKHPEFKRNLAESSSNSVARSLTSLLAVNPTHLDSDVELKRFFGSKVVAANKDKPGGNSKRAHVSQRSVLTKPQATWAPAHMREGLSARQLTEEEVVEKLSRNRWDTDAASEKWWTVEYSKKYKGITMLFLQTVLSGDPQGFYNILQGAPWHADSWLQLAEVFRHREEHSSAVDAVDRAMFAYERAFVGGFSFTSGTNRLDFDRVENRPFFLALHRQASDLQRRGCMRTAFEFAKLLYSLDPWGDPHGAVLHLDFLALKAGMSQWLLDVFALFEANFVEKSSTSPAQKSLRVDPSVLPGWAYAKALALKLSDKEGGESAGTAALIEAADSFPSVIPLLADKLDVMLSASIRGHRDFRIETDCRSLSTPVAILHLLSHIYVQRSSSLWKDPEIINWFTETVSSHFSSLPSSLPPTTRRNRFLSLYAEKENPAALSFAVYRHIIVLETSLSFRSLFPFIPNSVLNSNSGNLACDPLPPPNKVRVSEYGETFFAGVDKDEGLFGFGTRRRMTRRERELEERRLARMIPDVNERRQVQAIFENNAHIQQRFPGGIVQFAQAMELLPPDALEDMFAAAAIGAEQDNGDRGMPGQMPGLDDFFFGGADNNGAREAFHDRPIGEEDAREDEEDDDDDEENEDEEEDIAPMPVRVIRNLLGRLWGAGANVNLDDSTDSDEEEIGGALRDHGGVD